MTGEALHVLENVINGLIVGTTFVLLAYSPLTRAIGSRILHGKLPAPGTVVRDDARLDEMSGEVAAMRHHLDETLERLDFAERMLAQTRERGALGAGKDS
jgi:hypothetical protein